MANISILVGAFLLIHLLAPLVPRIQRYAQWRRAEELQETRIAFQKMFRVYPIIPVSTRVQDAVNHQLRVITFKAWCAVGKKGLYKRRWLDELEKARKLAILCGCKKPDYQIHDGNVIEVIYERRIR